MKEGDTPRILVGANGWVKALGGQWHEALDRMKGYR